MPVFANGNILFPSDISRCLKETGCDGVMSAEGQLYNPALFNKPDEFPDNQPETLLQQHKPHVDLALEYLDICKNLKTFTPLTCIKGHLFKILLPGLSKNTDLREKLGKAQVSKGGMWASGDLQPYVDIILELKQRMEVRYLPFSSRLILTYVPQAAAEEAKDKSPDELVKLDEATGLYRLPHWLSQPYFRAPPPPPKAKSMCYRHSQPVLLTDPTIAPKKRTTEEDSTRETKRRKVDAPVADVVEPSAVSDVIAPPALA